jgi:hypothetical protein
MPMIAAAAASAFAAVSSVAATVSAAVAASTVLSTAMTVIKVLSVASSIYSLTRKPKSGIGSPSPVSFKADPNAPITFVAGEAAVGGNMLFGQTHAPKNRFLTYVTALSHGGPVQSVEPFTAGDEVVTFGRDNGEGASGRYQDRMWQKFALGVVGAAALAMTSTATKYTPARAGPLYEWTANHKASGLAHTMWTMWSDTERLPNGVPKPLWVVHGGPVYDPRKDSTYAGGDGPQRWFDRTTWSLVGNENPHLHALTFLIGHFYNGKKVGGAGIHLDQIDVASFVQGANVCDANGWRLSYPWTTAMRKWDVLTTMLQAGGARPIARGAKISCVTNTPRVSLATIGEADLVGDFSVTGSQRVRDRINTVIPRCRLPSLKWTVQPFGKVTGAVYVAEDGGKSKPRELEYEGVKGDDGGVQVRQLAAYDLTALREGLVATLPLTVKWLRLRAGDCITIDAPETLMNGQKVVIIKRDFDPATAIVTVTVQSETDGKHAFALGQTDSPPPTPALTGVDPLVLEPPAPDAWLVEPRVTAGGGVIGPDGTIPVVIVRPGGGDQDGTYDEPSARAVLIRYRRAGLDPATGLAYEWSAPQSFPPSSEAYEITGLSAGITYRLEIAYQARGITSDWTDYGTVTVPPLVATDTMNVATRPASDIVADLDAVPGRIATAIADLDAAISLDFVAINSAVTALDSAVATLDSEMAAGFAAVDSAVADLNTSLATLDLAVSGGFASVNAAISGLDDAVADLDDATAAIAFDINDPATGIKTRVGAVEVVAAGVASRATVLETQVQTPTTGLLARTGSLETATANLATGKADASRVTILEARANASLPNMLRNADFSAPISIGPTWEAQAGGAVAQDTGNGGLGSYLYFSVPEFVTSAVYPANPGDTFSFSFDGESAAGYVYVQFLPSYEGGTSVGAQPRDWATRHRSASGSVAPAGTTGVRIVLQRNGAPYLAVSRVKLNTGNVAGDWSDEASARNVTARVGTLETATADLATGKADASRVTTLEAQVQTATTGLLARTGSLETATANLATGKADASRVTTLETQVQAAGTGLLARTGSLETATSNLQTGKADASRVTTLETQVQTAGTGLLARTGSLETATANLTTGKADATRVTILEARATSVPNLLEDSDFSRNAPGAWILEAGGGLVRYTDAQIGTYASITGTVVSKVYPATAGQVFSVGFDGESPNSASAVYLQAFPDYAGGGAVYAAPRSWEVRKRSSAPFTLPAGQTGIRVVIVAAGGEYFNISRIKMNVGGVAADWTDDADTHSTTARVGTLETATADLATGKADASRVTTLEAQVQAAGTGLLARTGSLETATSNLQTGKADASRVTTLETQVQAAGTGLLARTGSLETATSNLATGKADASRVTTLETQVQAGTTGLLARTGALETATSNLTTGKADATRVTVLEARAVTLPNLLRNSDFSGPVAGSWISATGAAVPTSYDASIGSYGYTTSEDYIASEIYAASPGQSFSFSFDGESTSSLSYGVVQFLPSYSSGAALFATQSWGQRKYSVSATTAPAGTTGVRVVFTRNGAAVMAVSRVKLNIGTVATAWSDEATSRSVTSRVGTLETATADLATGKADASRVTTLETQVQAGGTGLLARTGSLETATSNLATGKADASRVTTLETQVQTATTGLLARTGAVETATANLTTGKADASRVAVLEARSATTLPNILRNADFSRPITSDDWEAEGGKPMARDVGNGGLGSYLYFTEPAYVTSAVYPANPGDTFSLSYDGEGPSGRIFIQFVPSYGEVGSVPATPRDWATRHRSTGGSVAPAGTTGVRLVIDRNGGTYFAVTRIKLNTGAVPSDWSDERTSISVQARAASLETATANLATGKADASRVTTLETQVQTATTGLLARAASLETATANLQTGKADASRVTTLEARATTLPNLLRNGDFSKGMTGWAQDGANVWGVAYDAAIGSYANLSTAPYIYSENYPCGPGQQFSVSYDGESPSGDCQAYIQFIPSYASGGGTDYTADRSWSNRKRMPASYSVAAPAGTTAWRVVLTRGSGAYANYSRIKVNFGPAAADWTDEATDRETLARVTTSEAAVADLYGRTYARWALGVAVPGADAFIEARAETSPGSAPTSSVAIGARQFAVYNPADAGWKKALEVIGGNVVLSGGLQAGAFIRLGSGAGWPVALRAADFNATDGGVVSFGTDLGGLPSLTFAMNNLDPLGTGETYDVRATGLSATGFTLYAKINVPGTPSTFNRTAATATSAFGAGGLYIDKSGDANSTDGSYRVIASGQNHHYVFGKPGTTYPEVDDYDYVSGEIEVWALKSSVWQYIASVYVESMLDRRFIGGGVNHSGPWSFDETLNLGDNVSAVGLRHATNDAYAHVDGFSNLMWTAPGTASGVRSATGSGQSTRITVRPS